MLGGRRSAKAICPKGNGKGPCFGCNARARPAESRRWNRFCKYSRRHCSFLRRLDFLPRRRAPEMGNTIERYGSRRVPVRRKGNVHEVLSLALQGQKFPVRHQIPQFHGISWAGSARGRPSAIGGQGRHRKPCRNGPAKSPVPAGQTHPKAAG